MKNFLTVPLLTVIFAHVLLSQQPPAPHPTPPAAASAPTPPPSSPAAPPAPVSGATQLPPGSLIPGTGTPVVPSSTAASVDLATFHHILQQERDEQAKRQAYIQQAQQEIDKFNSRITAYDQIAQDEFLAVKKKEGWGEDVTYDGATDRFVRGAKKVPAQPAAQPQSPPPASQPASAPPSKPASKTLPASSPEKH